MQKSAVVILTNYFNVGEGKVPNTKWLSELRALSDEEKAQLAQGVCDVLDDGTTVKP